MSNIRPGPESTSSTSTSTNTGFQPTMIMMNLAKTEMGPDWVEFLSGGGAAAVNILTTFPIHKVVFKQQLYGVDRLEAVDIVRQQGLKNLYRGVLPPLLNKAVTISLMFGLFDQYTRIVCKQFPDWGERNAKLLAAFLAGTTEAVLMPFERVQTLLMEDYQKKQFRNTFQALKHLHNTYGIPELYRGLSPILLRNGPTTSIFFACKSMDEGKLKQRPFLQGAALGGTISWVFYMTNVAKTHMQSMKKTGFVRFGSPGGALKTVYNQRGCKWFNMFKGAGVNSLRASISWAIINKSQEFFKSKLNKL